MLCHLAESIHLKITEVCHRFRLCPHVALPMQPFADVIHHGDPIGPVILVLIVDSEQSRQNCESMLLWFINQTVLQKAQHRIHSYIDIVKGPSRNRATQVRCVDLIVLFGVAVDECVDPRQGKRILFELLEFELLRDLECRGLC